MFLYRVKNLYVGQLVFISPKLKEDKTIKLNKTTNYIIYSRKKTWNNTYFACDVISSKKYEPYFKNKGMKIIRKDIIYSYSVLEIRPIKYDKPFITKKKLIEMQSNIEKEYLHKNNMNNNNKVKIYSINSKS